jgi:membrane protease YdiL (CAAX protease family)
LTTPDGTSESDAPETRDEAADPQPPAVDPRPRVPHSDRIGASVFTIEGRAAPALFILGWLASILGLGLVLVGVLAGGGPASLGLIVVGLLILSIGLISAAGSQGIERRARGALAYTGPSPILVFAAALPVSILAVIVIGLPLTLIGFPLEGPPGALLSVVIQAIVYIALIRLLVVDTGALDWTAMGIRPLDRAALGEMLRGAVWALPAVFATSIVALVLVSILGVSPESPLPPTGEPVGFALSLLAGVAVAPFAEEIMFRGFATTAWVRALGARGGLIRAALVFAFAHVLTTSGTSAGDAFGLAVVNFGARVPIALALGWLFVRRGTIWASFGLHAAFNAVLLVVAELYEVPG